MLRAVEIRITGKVQGVFFRASCAEYARHLGVRGWVRNEPDGSVRAHIEGGWTSVEEMLAWCREGPPAARGRDVHVSEVDAVGGTSFEVAH